MNKQDYQEIKEIRLEILEKDGFSWSFPIRCPRWLFWILLKLEKR